MMSVISMFSKAWSCLTVYNYNPGDVAKGSIISAVLIVIVVYSLMSKKTKKDKVAPLPPGPRGLPLVGNLLSLESDFPRYLADLAKTYGPIFKLQLGSRLCVVISSPSSVKEVLKDHDVIFANHDPVAIALAVSYGGISLGLSPYGENWRMLRKVYVTQLLTNQRIESLYEIRRTECHRMFETIKSMIGTPILIHDHVNATLFGTLAGMLWGGSQNKQLTSEFRKFSQKFVDLLGEINISDVFPVLSMFDLQGKAAKMKKLMLWFDKMFDPVIEQRLKGETTDEQFDYLQILLNYCRDEVDPKSIPLSINHIKSVLLEVMIGGTKSTTSAVEWALAELLLRPHLMNKAQKELEQVVGLNNIVEEHHLPSLPNINAIVKESLRLHPGSPMLLPRLPSESCVLGGYLIPKGTKIIINAWAIHRDPAYWDNPLEFRPERFLNSSFEYDNKGTCFTYLPFGSGRRVCVGYSLAATMISYSLATLLHSFDWKLEDAAKLDMSEAYGVELTKKVPLVVIPAARQNLS